MSHSVTGKGQVTIPKPVRDVLGIQAGSGVPFVVGADGRVTLELARPARPRSHFARLRGAAGGGPGTDEILKLTRGG